MAQRGLARRQSEAGGDAAIDEREPADRIALVAERRRAHAERERAVARDRQRLGDLIGAGAIGVLLAIAREALARDDRIRLRHERAPTRRARRGAARRLRARARTGHATGAAAAASELEIGDRAGDRGVRAPSPFARRASRVIARLRPFAVTSSVDAHVASRPISV